MYIVCLYYHRHLQWFKTGLERGCKRKVYTYKMKVLELRLLRTKTSVDMCGGDFVELRRNAFIGR